MKDDLNDMMVFKSVAELGSFTATALALGLPKSNISRKITRLETALGARLLERTTRSLNLTEIGRVYLAHCQRIFDEIYSANRCIDIMSNTPQGKIRIAASISGGQSLIAPVLGLFSQQFPDITLDLQLSNRRVDVINEAFDVAIRIGPSADSSMISKKLCRVKLSLFASDNYLTGNTAIKQSTDVANHACLYMNALDELASWSLINESENVQISLKPLMFCNDYTTLAQASINHMGVCMLPDYIADKYLKNNQLMAVLPNWSGPCIDIYAVYPSRGGVTPKLRALLDFLTDQLSQ
ncbi:MAG: LysR family transcriptional regulator [Psychrobium sp.]|nr:LysR family transcriptional regulator [Psychrobium sp.]